MVQLTSSGDAPTPVAAAPVRVVLDRVHKVYERAPGDARWRAMVPAMPMSPRRPHAALDGLDLVVRQGEALGIIGPNGAGKSTALRLVAGVSEPTSGSVRTSGTVASMIELGVGLHPELTGRENLDVVLALQGLRPREIRAAVAEVLEFADLGTAADVPVKRYSAGMRARLGFAASTQVHSDVLVIDEGLAAGDQDFQARCIERIAERVAAGSALLFVSHDTSLVSFLCTRVVQIRHGRVVDDGEPRAVVERYLGSSSTGLELDPEVGLRFHSAAAPTEVQSWDRVPIRAEIEVTRALGEPVVGVDLTLPTVGPDHVLASSKEPLAPLAEPGRYLLEGLSSPIPSDTADFRMTVSLVDGARQRRGDVRSLDVTVRGGRVGVRPGLNIEPEWSIHPVADDVRERRSVAPLRAPRQSRDPTVVVARNVTKRFAGSGGAARNVREAIPLRHRSLRRSTTTAVDSLSLTVRRGEAVGIIGPNGAGKSTLLRILAGVLEQDSGEVRRRGRVVALLDGAAAFHPELSGRENAVVLARLLGMSDAEFRRAWPGAVEMAGLGDAIDAPMWHYSDGMRSRLWFAVAAGVPADLLLIDELLSVGDAEFRRAAIEHVETRRAEGTAVLFVSHELPLVEEVCERTVWIRNGAIVADGHTSEVIDAYGGDGWSAGVAELSSGMRLGPLEVDQRHISVGGTLTFGGTLEVATPSPTARLEIAYQAMPGERHEVLDLSTRAATSMYLRTVVPPGRELARAGRYRFRCEVERNEFAGEIDVVASVIDGGQVIAEAWQQVTVGRARPEGFPSVHLRFDWEVHRLEGSGSPE